MKLITDLRQTTSRIDKEQLLKYASEIEKNVLYYAYNPHLKFGIANAVPNMANLGEPMPAMFNLLNDLAKGELTGNAARKVVDTFAENNGDLIYLICRKDLDCGITATTINKVHHGLIPEFNVQLAKEVPLNKLKYPLIAQIKYDGVRVVTLLHNGTCKFFTRNGKEINCPQLAEIMLCNYAMKQHGNTIMLDGELTTASGKMEGRTSISGRVNSAIHGGILTISDLCYNVFDAMSVEEFNSGVCDSKYISRLTHAAAVVEVISSNKVKLAYSKEVNNAEEANDYYTNVLEEGYEGLILKHKDHKYTFKRSKDWVKVKAIKTADINCLAIAPGKPGTKYENCIGALLCTGVVEGKGVMVSVGSGLSDEQRFGSRKQFENKVIEIEYNDVIRNKEDDGWTLFLPRFIAVREDK